MAAILFNYCVILFHSSSIALLSEPIFVSEGAFVLFFKMPHIA